MLYEYYNALVPKIQDIWNNSMCEGRDKPCADSEQLVQNREMERKFLYDQAKARELNILMHLVLFFSQYSI